MRSAQEGSITRPFNAFSEPFLQLDSEHDEPPAGDDPEGEGPWLVLPSSTPEWPDAHGLWPLGERPERGDPAAALWQDRPSALLAAIVRPLVGHDPFYELGKEVWQGGYPLLRHGRPAGWIGTFHQDWAFGVSLFERVVRSPLDVALLLEAAGPSCRRRAGAILLERLFGAGA